MDSFLAVEKALSYVRLENQEGPAGARNQGVKRSRNPYILFVDADVVLQAQALEWIRESLDLYSHRPDVAGVLGSYADTVPWDDFLTNFKNLYVCFIYQITETLSPYLHTPIFCVKKEILVKAGGFDPCSATTEDFRLGVLLGSQGHHFVIDRRVKGRHLKRYTLRSVAREDWRRISDLSVIKLSPEQRWFVFKAHRPHRVLAILMPGLVLLSLVLAITDPAWGVLGALLLTMFLVANIGFLAYCARQKGVVFAIKSCAFLFLEMLWAELALVVAFLPLPKFR